MISVRRPEQQFRGDWGSIKVAHCTHLPVSPTKTGRGSLWADDLYLRKVDRSQARDNYRVILKMDDDEIDGGSIGLKTFTIDHTAWTWGI
jgi:hypothetical protein